MDWSVQYLDYKASTTSTTPETVGDELYSLLSDGVLNVMDDDKHDPG